MERILDVIGRDTQLRHVASTHGGEWAGPCPFCGGSDRFRVWPEHEAGGQWWCRQCEKNGDTIAYVVLRDGLTPQQAYDLRHGDESTGNGSRAPVTAPATRVLPATEPPGPAWQDDAWDYVAYAQAALWGDSGIRALSWLHKRGLTDDTVRRAGLGYDPGNYPAWRCVIIPWFIGPALWAVRRRFSVWSKDDPALPCAKFMARKGSVCAGLYNADALRADRPAVIVEGELDVLSIEQECGALVTAVATGGISQARRARWVARLAVCPLVLIAFDAGDEAEAARQWWLSALANGAYWRPYWDDANGLLQAGVLRDWVVAGLASH